MNRRILIILLLAALLNLWGASWGAPDPAYTPTDTANHTLNPQAILHPDAFHFASRSFRMVATGDWNPHFFENPSLYVNLNALLHLLSGAASGHPVDPQYPEREYAPFPPYFMARVVSALMSVLLAAFTFALARLAFGVRAAELAALLAAVSFSVVQHGHYAATNVTAAAAATGALWLSLRVLRVSSRIQTNTSTPGSNTFRSSSPPIPGPFPHKGGKGARARSESPLAPCGRGDLGVRGRKLPLNQKVLGARSEGVWVYIAAGLMVGLTGSAKYNAGIVGGVYVLAGLVNVYRCGRAAWRPFIWGLVAVGAGFLVGTPFAVLDPRKFWQDLRYITSQYQAGQGYPESDYGLLFHLAHIAWYGMGLVAAALSVSGMGAALRRRRPLERNSPALDAALLLVFLIAYGWIVLAARRLGDHLTLPVIGVLAAFAGAGAAWVLEQLQGRALAAGFVALFVAMPLAYSVQFDALVSQPDTRQRAQAWVWAHVRPGVQVHLVGPYNVPLDPARYPTTQDFGHAYQPPDAVREAGASVVIVSDAVTFLYDGSEPFIPSELPALARDRLATYDRAMVDVARFERPRWFGDAWPLSTASYFHNPTLIVYCFPNLCGAVIDAESR
ncbi:MAG: hypothetical protein JXB47_21310 [Anaerolineae bacterium]|nr:hypothetical protein [Anaerolineae bacterium]